MWIINDHFLLLCSISLCRQLPHAPENLIATLSSSERRTINLTWAQAFDGNSPLIRYILEVSENSEFSDLVYFCHHVFTHRSALESWCLCWWQTHLGLCSWPTSIQKPPAWSWGASSRHVLTSSACVPSTMWGRASSAERRHGECGSHKSEKL